MPLLDSRDGSLQVRPIAHVHSRARGADEGVRPYTGEKKRPGEETGPRERGVIVVRNGAEFGSAGREGKRRRPKRSEDAGRRSDRSIDKSELRVGDVANRLIEIGMVQYVERLAK